MWRNLLILVDLFFYIMVCLVTSCVFSLRGNICLMFLAALISIILMLGLSCLTLFLCIENLWFGRILIVSPNFKCCFRFCSMSKSIQLRWTVRTWTQGTQQSTIATSGSKNILMIGWLEGNRNGKRIPFNYCNTIKMYWNKLIYKL